MRATRILLPIAILVIGGVGFSLLKATKSVPAPIEVRGRVWLVNTERVRIESLAPQIQLYGRVESPSLAKAAAPGNAVVDVIPVSEGQHVAQGDVLFRLDPRDFQPQVDQLDAQILQERNRHAANQALLNQEQRLLAIARENEQRALTLLSKNLGAQASVDDARRATQSQQLTLTQRQLEIDNHPTRLKSLQAQLQQARTQLSRSTLIAPVDAIIASVTASVGDQVRAGDVLLSYYTRADLQVRAEIPASYQREVLAAMANGQQLLAVADNGVTFRLHQIAGQATARGVVGLFRQDQGDLTPLVGLQMSLTLTLPTQQNSVAIPASALSGNDRVYVLQEGRMRAVAVERLGQVMVGDDMRLLVSGQALVNGSDLITTRLPNAMSGLRVKSVTADAEETR
ncbi:MAG TPA: RND transporter [Gammaproteobacteria bacterium]|jgi:multidrug efflux pump subunit AcrA (membrane-fusion protein)|nr:RND transporter [Gammaproteobacteria bacterium]